MTHPNRIFTFKSADAGLDQATTPCDHLDDSIRVDGEGTRRPRSGGSPGIKSACCCDCRDSRDFTALGRMCRACRHVQRTLDSKAHSPRTCHKEVRFLPTLWRPRCVQLSNGHVRLRLVVPPHVRPGLGQSRSVIVHAQPHRRQREPVAVPRRERPVAASSGAPRAASKAFDAVTVDDTLKILDAAVEGAAATEGAEARSELVGRVRLWACGAAGFEAGASISQLAASGKLDLSLDNKFVDEGRLNPLIWVCASSRVETRCPRPRPVHSRVADAFVALEGASAPRRPSIRAKGRRMSINGDFDAATLSLMLWDLHCTISYAQASG